MSRFIYRGPAAWLFAVWATLTLGCSEPTYPVHGRLIYKDGAPVTGADVWFESTRPPHQRSSASVNEKGEFSLATVELDSGAIAGEHIVRVAPMAAGPWNDVSDFTDPKYGDYVTTPLKVTIQRNAENNFVLEIERPPSKRK